MDQHLENFLSMTPGFKGEWTIKFFNKIDCSKQNSLLINNEDRTINDMKLTDVDVFNKVKEIFGDGESEEVSEDKKEVKMKEKIDVYEFMEKVISSEKHYVVGFISNIKYANDKKILMAPGSQIITYTIN